MTRASAFRAVLGGLLALAVVGCADGPQPTASGADPAAPKVDMADEAHTETTEVSVDNGPKNEAVNVSIVSWRDIPFQTVKHQAYDYSCGSAAVATLMTYVYGVNASEKDVFLEMFNIGNQDKIRKEGFSMLDMAHYLNNHGLNAKGYKLTIASIQKYGVPFIALVNNKGYNHFVVVKTMNNGHVLVGDPNIGNTDYAQRDFAAIWNGIALIVTNEASKAKLAYANTNDWRYARAHAPVRGGNDEAIDPEALAPMAWQIAPTNADVFSSAIVPSALTGSASSPSTGGAR